MRIQGPSSHATGHRRQRVHRRAAAPAIAERYIPGDQPLPGYTINNPPLARARRRRADHGAPGRAPPRRATTSRCRHSGTATWSCGRTATGATAHRALRRDARRSACASGCWSRGTRGRRRRTTATASTSARACSAPGTWPCYFRRLVDRPHRTYIAGVSMGGYIIGRSLEEYPNLYDGALPLCGVLGDHDAAGLLPRLQRRGAGPGRRARPTRSRPTT